MRRREAVLGRRKYSSDFLRINAQQRLVPWCQGGVARVHHCRAANASYDTLETDMQLEALKPAIILVEPKMGENIGSAARAMKNFGLSDLRLVNPQDGWPNPMADVLASHAVDVLRGARLYDSVESAIADLDRVYAATARTRFMNKAFVTSRQLPRDLCQLAAAAAEAARAVETATLAAALEQNRTGEIFRDTAECPPGSAPSAANSSGCSICEPVASSGSCVVELIESNSDQHLGPPQVVSTPSGPQLVSATYGTEPPAAATAHAESADRLPKSDASSSSVSPSSGTTSAAQAAAAPTEADHVDSLPIPLPTCRPPWVLGLESHQPVALRVLSTGPDSPGPADTLYPQRTSSSPPSASTCLEPQVSMDSKSALSTTRPPRAGVLFGRESRGLTNEEVAAAHKVLAIEADPCYPVLNLAQAVVVTTYELHNARLDVAAEAAAAKGGGESAAAIMASNVEELRVRAAAMQLASCGEVEEFFRRLFSELDAAEFFKHPSSRPGTLRSIRNLVARVEGLTALDVALMHGMLSKLVAARRTAWPQSRSRD